MSANLELAKERGLSDEDIFEINKLHEHLEALIGYSIAADWSKEVEDAIHEFEFQLQRLWKFTEDKRFHTWAPRYAFLCQWFGRSFRCLDTGETITLGKDIHPKQFISFGNCAIDLGVLNCYSRKIGNIQEITL
jgi:hypothetical protein